MLYYQEGKSHRLLKKETGTISEDTKIVIQDTRNLRSIKITPNGINACHKWSVTEKYNNSTLKGYNLKV